MHIDTRLKSDPSRWARVHLSGDRNAPFERRETPEQPFWLPEWEIRALLRKREKPAVRDRF